MKNIVLILISVFILIGCAPKEQVIIKAKPTFKEKEVVLQAPLEENKEVEIFEEEPVEVVDDGLNKIAVLFPSRIVGKYAKTTINTISAFLIYTNKEFEIETFDTYDEEPENILNQLKKLNDRGFTKVIAMFTSNGFDVLNTYEESKLAKFYFPLIHKSEIYTNKENFIFGGISYKKQLEILQTLSSGNNTMFYVKSYLGNKLKEFYAQSFYNPGLIKEIDRSANRYKYIMEDERIKGDTIILNTPIVKSSIILSQLTAYEIEPYKILSTQLNYSPLFVKLTQERDRKNFYVLSSISEVDSFIEEYTKLFGADITYNWVDYSSLIGVNYLLYENESVFLPTNVKDNQVEYESTLYESTAYGFDKVQTN